MNKTNWRELVTVGPPEAMEFVKYSDDIRYKSWLVMLNESDVNCAFKVSTTMKNNYNVRPNKGIIRANTNELI